MNAALTILSGLALLVLGQIIIRAFLDPIFEVRKFLGEIADGLVYYARFYANPDPGRDANEEANRALRRFGSQLEAKAFSVPCYKFFSWIRAVPPWESILQARRDLIGLSNGLYRPNDAKFNEKRRQQIAEKLNLRTLIEEKGEGDEPEI